MTLARRLFTAWITASALLVSPTVMGERPQPSAAEPGRVLIVGKVVQRLNLGAADLAALPQHVVTVTYKSGSSEQTHTFSGPKLLDVLALAQPDFDADIKNDKIRHFVLATASDGYQGAVAWGEFDPELEAKTILVAIVEDGISLADIGPTLVVPGDIRGSRYVSGITSLRLAAGPYRR